MTETEDILPQEGQRKHTAGIWQKQLREELCEMALERFISNKRVLHLEVISTGIKK